MSKALVNSYISVMAVSTSRSFSWSLSAIEQPGKPNLGLDQLMKTNHAFPWTGLLQL